MEQIPLKNPKPLLYFVQIPVLLLLSRHSKPSPFFEPEDQSGEDTKENPIDEDDDEERFTRNARENHSDSVDYYNNWIMENVG